MEDLEHALACAKAGELQVAQLEVALAAATRRSEVVARRVVGLEVELEGVSRLLNALEEDEEEAEHATYTQEESPPCTAKRIAAESDKGVAVPLCSSLAIAWQEEGGHAIDAQAGSASIAIEQILVESDK